MLQPTPEQMAVLKPMERFAYRLGDLVSQRLPWLSSAMNTIWMKWLVWLFGGRRFVLHGLEHLQGLERSDRVLLVANHRSFYDFFVVMCTLWFHTKAPTRIVMPVRSTYFYDHFTGPFVNLAMSGYSMFPPILRDRERGRVFNKFSSARMLEEMSRPGTVMGMHPEGTRSKGPDPYTFLEPKPGSGRIIRRTPGLKVVPVFVLGMTNNGWHELYLNWTQPQEHPIDLVYGAPIDFDDLCALPDDDETHMRIVERVMEHLEALAAKQRALRSEEAARSAIG